MKKEFPIVVNFCGRKRVILSKEQLWSQHEIAMTLWPVIGGRECAQMRVRGKAGDRDSKNYLVVSFIAPVDYIPGITAGRAASAKVLRPLQKYFVRDDPYQTR